MDFVFKGGTAVMLLLDRARRFSIDIDIVKDGSIERETLEKLSLFPDPGAVVSVKTPTIDGICGDKLTAFAPNTLGIPYEKSGLSATLEIIKQLFDIGHLFEKMSDIEAVRRSYVEVGRREAEYRNGAFSLRQSLEDTIQTALVISTEGALGVGNYSELRKGIDGVKQFVFSYRFGVSHAVTHAARAAYMAASILYGESALSRFEASMDLQPLVVGKKPLDKLKKSNPEAFYYWHRIEKLRGERDPALSLS